MPNKPGQIGITGGIGAGKSIVAKIFHTLGVPIYDADTRAKWLMNNDSRLLEQMTDLFGENVFKENKLDREYLGQLVFKSPEKLEQLNSVVHPRVRQDYNEWVRVHEKHPYLLKEAALLFESGSHKGLNKIIHVTAPKELRISRVLQRDPHRTREDVKNIIRRQWPEEKKKKLADYVIKNDGSRLIIPQVLELHSLLSEQV